MSEHVGHDVEYTEYGSFSYDVQWQVTDRAGIDMTIPSDSAVDTSSMYCYTCDKPVSFSHIDLEWL